MGEGWGTADLLLFDVAFNCLFELTLKKEKCYQRVWRGYHAVCKAADAIRLEWDAYVANEWVMYQPNASIQLLSDRILRPFLFFFGIHQHKNKIRVFSDKKRFVTCFTILLQSISSPGWP